MNVRILVEECEGAHIATASDEVGTLARAEAGCKRRAVERVKRHVEEAHDGPHEYEEIDLSDS